MDAKGIEARLLDEAAVILARPRAGLAADRPLHEMGFDSMGLVELLVFVEKTFGVSLADAGLGREDFGTLGALARRIARGGGGA